MGEPVVDLLQALIRNECVNDGSAASGFVAWTRDLVTSTEPPDSIDETSQASPTP